VAVVVTLVLITLAGVVIISQSGVGGGPGGTPIYTGATVNTELKSQLQQGIENVGITGFETGAYTSSSNTSTVFNWYQTQMPLDGWTEENEISTSSDVGFYLILYKHDNTGAIVFIMSSDDEPGTIFAVITGPWTTMGYVWDGIATAYTAGLSVSTPTIIAGSADGSVYDQDQGAGENYINGRMLVLVKVTQGGLRDIDDPTYGFTVSLSNGRSGWNFAFGQSDSMSAPASGASGTITFQGTINIDATGDNQTGWVKYTEPSSTVNWSARISVDSQHRWVAGSSMIFEVDNLVWDSTWTTLDNVAWKEADTINVVIAGRDTLSLTQYSGAYLGGTRIG
jgi:hypothetical protein